MNNDELKNSISRLNVLEDERNKILDSIKANRKEYSDYIAAMLSQYFETHPDVVAITWTQYAPHFNDGDACVFSVNDVWALTKSNILDMHDLEEDDVENLYEEIDSGLIASESEDYAENYLSTSDLNEYGLGKIFSSDEVMRQIFGDDSAIVLIRGKTTFDRHFCEHY